MAACGEAAALLYAAEQDEAGRLGTMSVSSLVFAGSLPLREVSTCVWEEAERTQLRSQTNRAINLVNTSVARESFRGPLCCTAGLNSYCCKALHLQISFSFCF